MEEEEEQWTEGSVGAKAGKSEESGGNMAEALQPERQLDPYLQDGRQWESGNWT